MRTLPKGEYCMSNTILLIAAYALSDWSTAKNTIQISNDTDVDSLQDQLDTAQGVELHFPKFSDGRAFSQAVQLRRRHGYTGDIRATGDVLIDQLVQMQRSGFSSAVLRDDQDAAHGQKLLAQYAGFYQGDAAKPAPRFAESATSQEVTA
jgi:uncharacterized protein (DUF934 family)